MRRISIDYDLAINIYNRANDLESSLKTNPNGKKLERLFNEQIFILPYSMRSKSINDTIDLLYGGIIGFLDVNKDGVEGHGFSFFSEKFSEAEITSTKDIEKKIEEYLQQTPPQITSKRPITIVHIDHCKDSVIEAEELAVKAYKDLFIIENTEELKQKYNDAIIIANKKIKEWYDPNTKKGKENLALEANMKMYFGAGPEILAKAGEILHPKGGELFKYE